jgi:hypothetical protein
VTRRVARARETLVAGRAKRALGAVARALGAMSSRRASVCADDARARRRGADASTRDRRL